MSAVPVGWKGLSSVVLWEAGVYRDERGLVRVPYRRPDGTMHNEKVHARHRSWWATSGLPLMPFGLDCIPAPDEAGVDTWPREERLVWIAEGESDALCLREHYAEWRGRPVDVLALPGAGTWRKEWATFLAGYRGVYVFPDRDRAGERMAASVTRTADWSLVVWLPPGDDVRGLVQRDGPDSLNEHILDAEGVALVLVAMSVCNTLEGARRWLQEVTW